MVEDLAGTADEAIPPMFRRDHGLDEDWRYCAMVSSGDSMALCAARAGEIAGRRRRVEVAAMTAAWSPAEKAAFAALEAASDAFFESHAQDELNLRGPTDTQPWIPFEEDTKVHEEFVEDLRAFEQGRFPTDGDVKKADAELNAMYQRVMKEVAEAEQKNPDSIFLGAVTREGIRKTEVLWLRFRDAWVKFGTVRYPKVPENTWKTWATTKRLAQLKEILNPL
jgi:uncharacterized protein YecT (DUF1311 family)